MGRRHSLPRLSRATPPALPALLPVLTGRVEKLPVAEDRNITGLVPYARSHLGRPLLILEAEAVIQARPQAAAHPEALWLWLLGPL